MKKFLALLIITAASAGVYYEWDDLNAMLNPEVVEMSQPAASAPEVQEEDDGDEEDMVAESAPSASATASPVLPKAPKVLAKPTVKPEAIKLVIKEIKFDGVTAFSHAELAQVVNEFVGQELTIEQAMAIPVRVTKYYQERNLVARATLVGSLARDGMLKIGVIETSVKQAQLDQALVTVSAAQVQPKPAVTTQSQPQPASKELTAVVPATPSPEVKTEVPVSNVAKLEVREDATVVAKFEELSPMIPIPEPKQGKREEDPETAFILQRYAKHSRQYELLVDNYGNEATGSTRLGAGLEWRDALSEGDKFSLVGLKSQGSRYLQVAYEWATGIDGLKLAASASNLSYDVINNLQAAVSLGGDAVKVSGDAVKKGVQIAYDLVSGSSEMSTLGLRYDTKKINATAFNYADSAYYDTKVMGIEFKGFEREMVPGGAVMTYDAVWSRGTVDMNGSPNRNTDLNGEKTAGAFSKFRLNGSVSQPLGGMHSVFAALTLQRANKNLDGSEKIYLGGPAGVRAYGVGEGMGSDGEVVSLEFRQRVAAGMTLAEFYDWGHVRPWHDGNAPGAPANNRATLSGVGLSLSQKFDSGITVKGTWAYRLGDEPDPASMSMPSGHDGKFDRNRFWLSMESRF